MSTAGPAAPSPDSRPSVGEAFAGVAADLSLLMRQEVELAKAELRQSAIRAGRAPACWPAPAWALTWWRCSRPRPRGGASAMPPATAGRRSSSRAPGLPSQRSSDCWDAGKSPRIGHAADRADSEENSCCSQGRRGNVMTSEPDQIRDRIDDTRAALSQDVNTLADTVNPASAAKRTAASAKSAVLAAKDKVMGAASDSASAPAPPRTRRRRPGIRCAVRHPAIPWPSASSLQASAGSQPRCCPPAPPRSARRPRSGRPPLPLSAARPGRRRQPEGFRAAGG